MCAPRKNSHVYSTQLRPPAVGRVGFPQLSVLSAYVCGDSKQDKEHRMVWHGIIGQDRSGSQRPERLGSSTHSTRACTLPVIQQYILLYICCILKTGYSRDLIIQIHGRFRLWTRLLGTTVPVVDWSLEACLRLGLRISLTLLWD